MTWKGDLDLALYNARRLLAECSGYRGDLAPYADDLYEALEELVRHVNTEVKP